MCEPLLRAHRDGPRCGAAEQCDELAPPHVEYQRSLQPRAPPGQSIAHSICRREAGKSLGQT